MDGTTWFAWLFFGIWALVGLVFVLVAWILRRVRLRRAERCTACVTGTVVELEYRHRGEQGGAYYPVVEFPVNGQKHRVRSSCGSRPARYAAGDSVTVRYDPENPDRFELEGDRVLALLERVFLFVGLGCVLIGSLVAYGVSWLRR